MPKSPKPSTPRTVASAYQYWLEQDAAAHKTWGDVDKAVKRLARLAKIGRKKKVVVRISENRGLEITNQFKTSEDKIFTPAFCRRYKIKEVPLEPENS